MQLENNAGCWLQKNELHSIYSILQLFEMWMCVFIALEYFDAYDEMMQSSDTAALMLDFVQNTKNDQLNEYLH